MVLTLEAWLRYVPRHELIGTFRHPLAVARSLHKRSGLPLERGLALWTAYNRRLIQLHQQHAFPILCFDLRADTYLERCRLLCQRIGLRFDAQAASDFYSQQLISQTCDDAEGLDDEAWGVYGYLIEHQLTAGGETKEPARLAG